MLDLEHILRSRLFALDFVAKRGVMPGEMDSIELEQLKGRIKELRFIIKITSSKSIAEALKCLKEEDSPCC